MSDITHKFTKLHNTQRQETPLHKRHTLICRDKLHYFVELINCLTKFKQNLNKIIDTTRLQLGNTIQDHLPNIALFFPFRSIHTNLLSQDVSPVPWFT